MLIKNIAEAGRGIGVKGHGNISFAPGEVKDVDDDVIAEARKDPANAATLTEEGGLVILDEMVANAKRSAATANPSGTPEDIAKINAAAEKAKADHDARVAAETAEAEQKAGEAKAKAGEEAAKVTETPTLAHVAGKPAHKGSTK